MSTRFGLPYARLAENANGPGELLPINRAIQIADDSASRNQISTWGTVA